MQGVSEILFLASLRGGNLYAGVGGVTLARVFSGFCQDVKRTLGRIQWVVVRLSMNLSADLDRNRSAITKFLQESQKRHVVSASRAWQLELWLLCSASRILDVYERRMGSQSLQCLLQRQTLQEEMAVVVGESQPGRGDSRPQPVGLGRGLHGIAHVWLDGNQDLLP